ncbi:MAG: hypothetical protein BWY83_02834 [bacterium ADurb.Bin478]|nr:MAG: hypothetical protein BWY83_02834 [bacterium ADurb.Bin478]
MIILRTHIAAQGGYGARHIRRTAGTAEPWRTVLTAVAFQTVDVKKRFTVLGNAGEHAVIETAFDDIGIAAVAVQQRQPVIPLRQRNSGAGFLISGRIGQIVIFGKPLVMTGRSDAPGDVLVALDRVAPYALNHFKHGGVIGDRSHIGGAGEQITGAHSVALDGALLAQRHVVLPVRAVVLCLRRLMLTGEKVNAAVLDKKTRQIKIARLTGHAPQFNQRQFDLRMAGIPHALARPGSKHRANVIGKTGCHAQQRALAGGLIMGHSRLEKMAGAIELVIIAQISPALVRLVDRVIGVEIPVCLLSRRDPANDGIDLFFQRCIRMGGQ